MIACHRLVDLVVRETAAFFVIRPEDLLGDCREQEYTTARHVAIYLARELTGLSLMRLGDAFNREHTTIMHAVRKITERLAHDSRLAAILDLLRDRIGDDLEARAGEGEAVLA